MPERPQSWQRKEINTRPPGGLQSAVIKFDVGRSMLSNNHQVLVEERSTAARPPSDLHGPRGNRPPGTRNSYLVGARTLSTTPLHLNIVNLPFTLPIIHDRDCSCSCQGLAFRQLSHVLKHAPILIGISLIRTHSGTKSW